MQMINALVKTQHKSAICNLSAPNFSGNSRPSDPLTRPSRATELRAQRTKTGTRAPTPMILSTIALLSYLMCVYAQHTQAGKDTCTF